MVKAFVMLMSASVAAPLYAQGGSSRSQYAVIEERNYGVYGFSHAEGMLDRTSSQQTDGTVRNDFTLERAFAYDSTGGLILTRTAPAHFTTAVTAADGASLSFNGLPIVQVPRATNPPKCRDWDGSVLVGGATAATVSMRRRAGGGCQIIWSAAHVKVNGHNGDFTETLRGAVVTTDALEPLASVVSYNSDDADRRFHGQRSMVLAGPRADNDVRSLARIASLASTKRREPRLDLKATDQMVAAADGAAIAAALEADVLAQTEGRSNPLPLILTTAFMADQLSTALINGVGAGTAAVGAGLRAAGYTDTGNAFIAEGRTMLEYNGLLGAAVVGIAVHFGGEEVRPYAELAYQTASLLVGSGIARQAERTFVNGVLEWGIRAEAAGHDISLPVTAAGALLEQYRNLSAVPDAINLLGYNVFLTNWGIDYLNRQLDLGPTNLALDMVGARGADNTSPTDTARDLMSSASLYDQQLRQITEPRSPFNTSIVGDFGNSTAGFADVVIGGNLTFNLFDSGVEDGDIVDLNAFGSGAALSRIVNLTNAGQTFNLLGVTGLATISITAENEGDLPPNTGGITILSPILSGSGSQTYNLNTGQTGTMRVFVAGRRGRP